MQELSKKGVVARAKDQPGWVLGQAAKSTASKPSTPAAKPTAKPSPSAAPTAPAAKRDITPAAPTLRQHIVNLLKRAKRPLKAKELAARVLAAGYQTASNDFANVVSTALKKMAEVQRVPGQGYVLKHTPA